MPYGFLNSEQQTHHFPIALVVAKSRRLQLARKQGRVGRGRGASSHTHRSVPSDQLSSRIFCNDKCGY